MSQQQKNQKNKKGGKSSHTNPTAPNQQQSTGSNRHSVTSNQESTSQQASQVIEAEADVEIENQVINTLLDNLEKRGAERNKLICENIMRDELRTLEAKLRKCQNDVGNQSEVWDLIEEIDQYAQERWAWCGDILEVLSQENTTHLDNMESVLNAIDNLTREMLEQTKEGEKQEQIFSQQRVVCEQKLDKINKEIDFETKIRDDICIQISEANKTEKAMLPTIENFRKASGQLKDEINLIKARVEEDDKYASDVKASVLHWISEKEESIGVLDGVRSQLKKDKKKLNSSLKAIEVENQELCNEVDNCVKENQELEDEHNAEQNANQLVIDAAISEFEKEQSLLSDDLEKVANDTQLLQTEMDKKQCDYDGLKQLLQGTESIKEDIAALEERLRQLEGDKWKQTHKIAVMEEYLEETNDRDRHSENDSSESTYDPKRPRLSSSGSNDDEVRSLRDTGTSFDVKDFASMVSHRSAY